MQAIIILGSIAASALFIYVCVKTSEHCLDKYEYNPFSVSISFLMLIVWGFLISSAYCTPKDAAIAHGSAEWLNTYVLFGAGIFVWLATFIRLIIRTSLPVAVFAILVQSVLSIVIFLLAIAILTILQNEAKIKKERNREK